MSGVRDNLSGGVSRCSQISGLAVTVGFSTAGTIKATWTNPSDAKYKGVRIMFKTGGYPTSPTDGSVFYDSNDATPVSTFTKSGFTDGTLYYLRAFAYTYKNATRLYTTTTSGAQASGTPLQVQGQQIFTSSGTFTVPAGVTAIDVFLVGGGGGSGTEFSNGYGGSAGGKTTIKKALAVTPGASASVLVGAGGVGVAGSQSKFTIGSTVLTADGGGISSQGVGGNGGSGGGGGGQYQIVAGNGGSDGSNGSDSKPYNNGTQAFTYKGGTGQGSTTRAFGESGNTLYAGGGGGAWSPTGYPGARGFGGSGGGGNGQETGSTTNVATGGTANTGGGAGAHYGVSSVGTGGSGVVIVRWGY